MTAEPALRRPGISTPVSHSAEQDAALTIDRLARQHSITLADGGNVTVLRRSMPSFATATLALGLVAVLAITKAS